MVTVLGTFIIIATILLIGYPLLKQEEDTTAVTDLGSGAGNTLEQNKEAIFTTLGEIEFDYQMKKLSAEDYEELKNKYKRHAAYVLKQEDSELSVVNHEIKEVEREIEEEIKKEVQQLIKNQK